MFDHAPLLLAAALVGALGALPAWVAARLPHHRAVLGLAFAFAALALLKLPSLLDPVAGWMVHALLGALGIGALAATLGIPRIGARGALPLATLGLAGFGALTLGGFGIGRIFAVDLATRAFVGLARPLPDALGEGFVDAAVALLDPSLVFALEHPLFVASTAAVVVAAGLVLGLPRVLPALCDPAPGLAQLRTPAPRLVAAALCGTVLLSLGVPSLAQPADLALGVAAAEGLALCLLLRHRLLGRALVVLALLNWQTLPLLAALGVVGWLTGARGFLRAPAPGWSTPRSPWLAVLLAAALAGSIRNCDGLMTSLPDPAAPTEALPAPRPGMQAIRTTTYGFAMDAVELPGPHPDPQSARAACAQRGARLCTESEWFAACFSARPGEDAEAAGQQLIDACQPGRSAACVTPDGVRDLLGGSWEWVEPASDLPGGVLVLKGGSADESDGTRMQCDYRGLVHERWLPLLGPSSLSARCCRSAR